jgi:hypothetical protein
VFELLPDTGLILELFTNVFPFKTTGVVPPPLEELGVYSGLVSKYTQL